MQQSNNSLRPASERVLQTHVVAALWRLKLAGSPILFAGDMSGAARTPSAQLWAKNTGLVRGEPDLRVYGPGGRTLFVELKAAGGALSADQHTRHAELRALGHTVNLLRATTGDEAARLVSEMVGAWLAAGPPGPTVENIRGKNPIAHA